MNIASPSPNGHEVCVVELSDIRGRTIRLMDHSGGSAFWAEGDVCAHDLLEQFGSGKRFFRLQGRMRQPFASQKPLTFSAISKDAVMTNLHKALGQDMSEETADKFCGVYRHDFPAASVSVIAPFESNHAIFKG